MNATGPMNTINKVQRRRKEKTKDVPSTDPRGEDGGTITPPSEHTALHREPTTFTEPLSASTSFIR